MNRSLPRRPVLYLAVALSLGLAGCGGQGFGPGLGQPSDSPDPTSDEVVEQTLDEITGEPTPPAGPETEAPPPGPETEVPQPPAEPTPEDCVSYDPANLTVAVSGDAWLLRDGNHAMKIFDTVADAEDAKRVARNWRQLCFIGRGNSGPDRYRHMVTYFREPSGLPLGVAPATIDCISYDPDDLDLYSGPAHPADPGSDEWALYSGPVPLLFLANEPDAQRTRLVASGYTKLCFIGAGNDRPDPFRYQLEWWRS